MFKVTMTKGGNPRINLRMEELVLLQEALLFEQGYLQVMHGKIEEFVNKHEEKQNED